MLDNYRANPLIIIIFGITGDLAQRKLLPALYNLKRKDRLPEQFRIVGISRQDVNVASIYNSLPEHMAGKEYDESIVRYLADNTEMVQLDMENTNDYVSLKARLHDITSELGGGVGRLYYLSIPAQAFKTVVSNLGETDHNLPFHEDAERPRILVEKPFGYDTASAQELIDVTTKSFGEEQTYRIDHYLAKETAQNILTFRFQNPLFQSVWNTRHIDSIDIVAHETIGIENRVAFYEQTGALRDILQSHLLQLLALITMEQPAQLDSVNIHKAKLRLLQSIATIEPEDVNERAVRGQYESYRREVNNPESTTETFARLQLDIDNEQWCGVNISLETGKGLSEKLAEVRVHFRPTAEASGTNELIFRLQPREGITMLLQAKQPGLDNETRVVEMDFDYGKYVGNAAEAYERVIIDAIRGDQSLFASSAEVLCSWRIIENVLAAWERNGDRLRIYPDGASALEL